ncbi:hypothetical protein MIND_00156000 [Mycena indigotica]|uniref:Uncharacterized protein n=1 Tax=Mycena indigotica TaxID=2126181 RepID=A0A8H6TGL1_9AGAR|nr:uncharacterized protein MIND_00156000 [Mycena indigotica]KAF7316372.1 hypothetical protein MIND_00156000 [Mycena indigotica]
MSISLALGSPCLAGYSLTLTVLNIKWVVRRFRNVNYPNSSWATLVLSKLQQMPLKSWRTVSTDAGDYPLLASLIVLPENDRWWEKLEKDLNYADPHSWSIASVTSISWVIVAYALTVVDAFTTISSDPNRNGGGLSGVGSIWLWMIPITIGYLQLSPRCDLNRGEDVLNDANQLCVVAGPNGVVNASAVLGESALTIQNYAQHRELHADQLATAPIYNYARLFSFVNVVEEIACVFDAAKEKAHNRETVSGADWQPSDGKTVHEANRRGTSEQIVQYCSPLPSVSRSHWGSGSGLSSRFLIAAVAGLTLQWSTIGGSIIIVYYSPTVGFGCRSTAYLLYAAVATVVWVLLVASAFLAHYAISPRAGPRHSTYHKAAEHISIYCRRAAKLLATLNSVWIVVMLLLQFSGFLDRCYCNSDVIGLGRRAYDVMVLLPSDIPNMKAAWVSGILLAVVCTIVWLLFLNLMVDPLPRPHTRLSPSGRGVKRRDRITTAW